MSTFRSNLNSINNNVLKFARHNDTHSDDALEILLTNIYTAVPAAIIVQSGVNYRTTDFQAWAIYYNPEQIYDPAAPNIFEVISQVSNENNFAYTGEFRIYNNVDLGAFSAGDYFCLTTVDYEAPGVYSVIDNGILTMSNVLVSIVQNALSNNIPPLITILWDDGNGVKTTLFQISPGEPAIKISVGHSTPTNLTVVLPQSGIISGEPIPAHGTTGRFGILLNQYNTTI